MFLYYRSIGCASRRLLNFGWQALHEIQRKPLSLPLSYNSILVSHCLSCRKCHSKTIDLKSKYDYFITTPIFYVNAVPHIGHLYTTVYADALARWQRIKGQKVIFTTGTDEHGLKIQQAAQKSGKTEQQYCDEVSQQFRELFKMSEVEYSDYIRTTEQRHFEAVQHFWNELDKRGYIYHGSYEGWYCTPDEAFLTESQVTERTDKNGNIVTVSQESGHPVEWVTEKNYLFRLSEFGSKLLKWLDTGVVKPGQFEVTLRQWIDEGLPDLSVSRQRDRLAWGIPVPGDSSQTIYVWLDALVNYLTVGGYPHQDHIWPANCHVVGKDILRFHAIYWPAFLMAAGLEPPQNILCHSHWLQDNQKMSKSKGNVVDPFDRLGRYTSDGLRYFLLREGVPHNDGNYGDAKVVEQLNSELCNTLGNMLNRCTAKSLNKDQTFYKFDQDVFNQYADPEFQNMIDHLHTLPDIVDQHFKEYNIYKAVVETMDQLRWTNRFIQHYEPWNLSKDHAQEEWLHTILAVTMESLRVGGILLQPVIPGISDKLLTRLNVPKSERGWDHLKPVLHKQSDTPLGAMDSLLFPRIKS